MKDKFYRFYILVVVLAMSCSDDVIENNSNLIVTPSPDLSVTYTFANPVSLTEKDTTFTFTTTLDPIQAVATRIYLSQISGTAILGEDYEMPPFITIPAYQSTVTVFINILSDELAESTETLTVAIGDLRTANAVIPDETISFEINNYVEDTLSINLSWETSTATTDNTGIAIDPIALANVRLFITDLDYTSIIAEAMGTDTKSLIIPATLPDGNYTIIADITNAQDGITRGLNLETTFSQVGEINDLAIPFTNALNTSLPCSSSYAIIARILKSGATYSITPITEKVTLIDIEDYVGTWQGRDSFGYETQITTSLDNEGQLQLTGAGFTWLTDYYGEDITNVAAVPLNVNLTTGKFTIDETYYVATTFQGDAQPDYFIKATGTLNPCSKSMFLDYDLIQLGFSFTQEDVGPGAFFETITKN